MCKKCFPLKSLHYAADRCTVIVSFSNLFCQRPFPSHILWHELSKLGSLDLYDLKLSTLHDYVLLCITHSQIIYFYGSNIL